MVVTGKLLVVGNVATFGAKKWPKREIVLETFDKYPQKISIELGGDKTPLVEPYKVGDTIAVSVNLRGREWKDPKTNSVRYFNTISGWKIDRYTPEAGNEAPLEPQAQQDDLPF